MVDKIMGVNFGEEWDKRKSKRKRAFRGKSKVYEPDSSYGLYTAEEVLMCNVIAVYALGCNKSNYFPVIGEIKNRILRGVEGEEQEKGAKIFQRSIDILYKNGFFDEPLFKEGILLILYKKINEVETLLEVLQPPIA